MDTPRPNEEMRPESASEIDRPGRARDANAQVSEPAGESALPRNPASDQEMELLLEQTPWVRRLARRMLIDENAVDDVVQDTYLAALQSPPQTSRPVLPWLGTVVRNFVRMGKRGDSRRNRREHAVASKVEQPSLVDPVERSETQQIVAESVGALREPYRTTVFLHFYRELTAGQIAELEGVPANTVRVRLKRALKQLEEKLDQRYDGRRSAWVLALLPLAGGGAPMLPPVDAGGGAAAAATATSGAATRFRWGGTAGITVASLAIVALLIGTLGWGGFDAAIDESGDTSANANTAKLANDTAAVASVELMTPAAVAADRAQPAEIRADHRPGFVPVRIVDAKTGRGIPGAEIYLKAFSYRSEDLARGRTAVDVLQRPFATELVATSDAEGRVNVSAERFCRERFVVRAAGYREQRERTRARAEQATTIRLEPASAATVVVVADGGDPLAGIAVTATGNQGHVVSGQTDELGVFSFSWQDTDYAIETEADGYCATRRLAELPQTQLTLQQGVAGIGVIASPDGQLVEDAVVTLTTKEWPGTPWQTTSLEFGRFETMALPETGSVGVTIRAAGFPSHTETVQLPWSDMRPFTLPSSARIAGRVLAPHKRAVSEGLVLLVPSDGKFRGRDLERVAVAEDGSFAFESVRPGNYQLLVEHVEWADQLVDIGNVDAHAELFETIQLDTGSRLAGVIRYPDGTPAAGVQSQIGWICGDELRGPLGESDEYGRFEVSGLWSKAPAARPVNRDLRWTAALGPEARDIRAALLLEVQRPHDLLSANGTAVRRFGIYGSRNTCEVAPGDRYLRLIVEAPNLDERPRFVLRNEAGEAVRTITNLLVIPPKDPAEGTNLIFGETTANPAKLQDADAFAGSLVGVLSRRYATTFVPVGQSFDAPIDVTLEPRRSTQLTVESVQRQPIAQKHLFVAPRLAQQPPFAAVYVGRTGDDGGVSCDFLASGEYTFYLRGKATNPTENTNEERLRPGISVVDLSGLLPVATVSLGRDERSPVLMMVPSLLAERVAASTLVGSEDSERRRSP